jgi:hypothetical protein
VNSLAVHLFLNELREVLSFLNLSMDGQKKARWETVFLHAEGHNGHMVCLLEIYFQCR